MVRQARALQGVTPWDKEWFRVTFGPTYQSMLLLVLVTTSHYTDHVGGQG
jgi:hypothetical protein